MVIFLAYRIQYRNRLTLRLFLYRTSPSALFCCHAAKILSTSQPLSQQIQRLEHEIGTPLLKQFTETGRAFLADGIEIAQLADHALKKAQGMVRGMSGQVSLNFASSVAFSAPIFDLIQHIRMHYPAMEFITREENMVLLMQDLQNGLLDAAFICLPCKSSNEIY